MVTWMRVLFSRIRGWISARKADEEFAQELTDHLELLTTEYTLLGMTPEEARRSARMQMGGNSTNSRRTPEGCRPARCREPDSGRAVRIANVSKETRIHGGVHFDVGVGHRC